MLSDKLTLHGKVHPSGLKSLSLVYAAFFIVAVLVFHWVAEGEFSAILTLSAIFQCLAFCILGAHTLSTGSVHGISAKSLQLEALALVCRLSCTTWLQGYLPGDESGDYVYQLFDILSLLVVLWLVHRVLKVQCQTYDAHEDSLQTTPFTIGCLVLAVFLHGDLNDRPVFDTLWMFALFVESVAVLPQLWLMTRHRSKIPAMTSHFIAVMAFARILSGMYMWHGHTEITCEPWINNFNHSGYAILAAHAVHLVLLADFGYIYVKNLATKGLCSDLEIPGSWMV